MTDSVRRPQESAVDPLSEEEITAWADDADYDLASYGSVAGVARARSFDLRAIATIRGLEAENARLREALERILAATPEGREEHRLARKALKAPR